MNSDHIEELPQPGSSNQAGSNNQQAVRQVLRDEESFILHVSQFFNENALSDVNIHVGEKKYYGHKFVLAISSDVFRTMLYGDSWTQNDEKDLILTESDECQSVFDVFLRFMYTAEVAITVDTAVGILCLADKYNVTSLKTLCVGYMVQNTQSPKVQNALHWYNWAKALHLKELIESCSKTIAWNIESILCSAEWHNMDLQFIQDILCNSELVVANEYMLYTGLVSWLQFESHRESLETNASTLLPLIRFPQMLVSQLYEIEKSDFYTKGQPHILKKLIGKAYRFRALCPTQSQLEVSFNQPFYRPRNYMDLAVYSVQMQNTLRFGIQVDVRTYVGPVVSEDRSGEWKVTYRKHENNWSINLFCHDSATVNGEAYVETSVLIFNESEKVIQLNTIAATVCSRASNLALDVSVANSKDAKNMVLLIKPVPH